jgi:hypothetical protein
MNSEQFPPIGMGDPDPVHLNSATFNSNDTSPKGGNLLEEIDANVKSYLSNPWKATLFTNGFLCKLYQTPPPAAWDYEMIDLFCYTGEDSRGSIIRFDPELFPVVPGG